MAYIKNNNIIIMRFRSLRIKCLFNFADLTFTIDNEK